MWLWLHSYQDIQINTREPYIFSVLAGPNPTKLEGFFNYSNILNPSKHLVAWWKEYRRQNSVYCLIRCIRLYVIARIVTGFHMKVFCLSLCLSFGSRVVTISCKSLVAYHFSSARALALDLFERAERGLSRWVKTWFTL